MSLANCIPGLIEQGRIRKGDGERARRAYARHFRRLRASMSDEAAAAEASRLTLAELDHANALMRRQTGLQIRAQQRILQRIDAGDIHATPIAILEEVDAQSRAVLGRLHARMDAVLFRHSRNLLGEARDKTGLRDLIREAFGEDTGNRSAKELVEGWRAASEYARQRFNRAGGNIAKRADWGLPQAHDPVRVRAVPYEQWRADILPKLDLSRMIDDATGQPFTEERIEEALRAAYDVIRSDGWIRREAGGMGQGKLANRRADHRFFVFKSADDWLDYHDKYGTGSAFDAMTGHVAGMARDIALMEMLGPNPRATLRWMQDLVQKRAAEAPDPGQDGISRARDGVPARPAL